MFKKTLGLLVVIGAIAVMIFGVIGTGAWFTGAEEITGNSITTGSLDLAVEGGPLTAADLEPGAGYADAGWFCVENVGDYDMKWRGWLYEVTDDNGLQNYLQAKAIITQDHDGNYGPADDTVIFENVPITQLIGPNGYIVLNDPVYPFAPDHKSCYYIQVKLVSTAPNTVQNSTLEAKFYIQGTQYINPGWSE